MHIQTVHVSTPTAHTCAYVSAHTHNCTHGAVHTCPNTMPVLGAHTAHTRTCFLYSCVVHTVRHTPVNTLDCEYVSSVQHMQHSYTHAKCCVYTHRKHISAHRYVYTCAITHSIHMHRCCRCTYLGHNACLHMCVMHTFIHTAQSVATCSHVHTSISLHACC